MPLPAKWTDKAPRLATIAKWVNENTHLHAWLAEGFCNTDQKIAGTRLRRPGKGRYGNHLYVTTEEKFAGRALNWDPEWHRSLVINHNAAETYRYNGEVVWKLNQYLREHPEKLIRSGSES